jgi:hypothetical protein
MDKEFTAVKVEILKLKLSFSELQVEKIQSIVNQEYETTFRINEIQFSIMSKLGQAKKFLEAELNSLELTVTNYPVIQEIHNLLLEFNYVNDEFKKNMEVKMRKYFTELKQLRKQLQQNGDFSQAQKVYLEYVEIGKFIGEIPQ